ncbi:MBL fold metallo-hydrolase [Neolewinella aurantiaca]|uniref:MBL fold metallo-hydrolase n=1 Tax=Neolewinella aurantiaca TaxID=2602767 RepID=A0A5C7FBE5_9BACT|nr:MBL fold metallo-hydrolase [Neolewinella aurantiaca]TXF88172.1 MBL fold metallo-hydrolase [Neolewinella aurantiaca]
MNRRNFLTTTAITALSAAPMTRLFTRGYRPAADPKLTMLRGNVGYYTNRGGTIGVYLPGGMPEGGVIVDTQFPDAANTLLAMLKEKGKLTQFGVLANTHHHGDHTSGNTVFAGLAGTHVSHERAKQNLIDSLAQKGEEGSVALPSTTFDGSWSTNLPDGKESISLNYFGKAHTGGDAVVHFENANVAHLGDLLFNRRFPYIDPEAGGNIVNWPNVLKDIRKAYNKDTLFIFGHAADDYPVVGTSADIKAFELYLKSLRRYVKKETKRGTSLEELKKKTTIIPGAPEWKFGEKLRDVNLEVMYKQLKR